MLEISAPRPFGICYCLRRRTRYRSRKRKLHVGSSISIRGIDQPKTCGKYVEIFARDLWGFAIVSADEHDVNPKKDVRSTSSIQGIRQPKTLKHALKYSPRDL
jgi:hypothetical protein